MRCPRCGQPTGGSADRCDACGDDLSRTPLLLEFEEHHTAAPVVMSSHSAVLRIVVVTALLTASATALVMSTLDGRDGGLGEGDGARRTTGAVAEVPPRPEVTIDAGGGPLLLGEETDVVLTLSGPGLLGAVDLDAGKLLTAGRSSTVSPFRLRVSANDVFGDRVLGEASALVDAQGRLAAWTQCSPPEACDLTLTDLQLGSNRLVRRPEGTDGFLTVGAFSPDAETLAIHTRAAGSGDAMLVLLDVRTREMEAVLGRMPTPSPLAWSSDGEWLFHLRPAPDPGQFQVMALHLNRRHTVALPIVVHDADLGSLVLTAG